MVRAALIPLQSLSSKNFQALITSLEQIKLPLQRTEEQSDISDAENKKAFEDIDARLPQKIHELKTRLTQQVQHSIASKLQEQASNAAKQARIVALKSSL